MKTKEEWIEELALEPHVEGGYFRQTYKAIETVELPDGRIRSLSTSILFLLTNQNTKSSFAVLLTFQNKQKKNLAYSLLSSFSIIQMYL